MHTYLFSNGDIRCYVQDLAFRLESLGARFPSVWYTLGESGDKIAEVLYDLISSGTLRQSIDVQPIYFNRTDKTVLLRDGSVLKPFNGANPALLIDGAVHSGTSMGEAAKRIAASGASEVLSYSFVVKRTSSFIPNYFGILVGEHDRPYFQLEVIPNNMLQEEPPFGSLRRICADDVGREQRFLQTGVGSIDRTSVGDLWYADQTEGSYVYVYECAGSIAAFISFRVTDKSTLYIEIIAADKKFTGQGLGGLLMRWAGTFARSCCCAAIELRAHVDRLSFYEKYGFKEAGEKIDIGEGEVYSLMRKRIIYTGNPVHLMELRNGRRN